MRGFRWFLLLFGVLMLFHVFDYAVAKQIQWDRGIDVREYAHPHVDRVSQFETWAGLAFLVTGVLLPYRPRRAV